MKEWQKKWDGRTKGRKLYTIVPKIGKNSIKFQNYNNKINRARLGAPKKEEERDWTNNLWEGYIEFLLCFMSKV